jgi:hypothetical protein
MQKLISLSAHFLMLTACLSPALGNAACRNETEIPSSTPTAEFSEQGDGTVTHQRTGLMWMTCPLGQSGSDCAIGSAAAYTWRQALQIASETVYAGYDDWHLPNLIELHSIVEERCDSPAINSSVFPGTPSANFSSSSPWGSIGIWIINFERGSSTYSYRDSAYHVRLVRKP